MASLPDPSAFALSVAVGSAHVLDAVLGSLGRAGTPSPALAVLLALPVLAAYLAAVTLSFAVRVVVVVVACCSSSPGDAAVALPSPAAVLGWLANAVAKLAAALFVLSGLAVALFCLLLA